MFSKEEKMAICFFSLSKRNIPPHVEIRFFFITTFRRKKKESDKECNVLYRPLYEIRRNRKTKSRLI
jgi:hypothetical protein